MSIKHQSHQERIDAELSFDWDALPASATSLNEISSSVRDTRLLRKGKSLRGISALSGLRRIWAYGVDQELLEELCCLSELEVLYIDRVSAVDLSSIDRLQKLRVLSIESAPKIDNLSWLPEHKSLQTLGLCNFKSLHDISDLASQTQLRSLAIDGGVWTPMLVESLRPLSSLKELQFLSLVNCRVADESLLPLCSLTRLKALHCAQFFSRRQFQELETALPAVRCDWFNSES
jgi:Leucine-rich repeat (LRR) protein